jgi:hypothetical protein
MPSSSLISAKLDGVKTYMRLRRVPTNIQHKVIKWFDYLWLTQKSSDEEKSISCLPGEFKQRRFGSTSASVMYVQQDP